MFDPQKPQTADLGTPRSFEHYFPIFFVGFFSPSSIHCGRTALLNMSSFILFKNLLAGKHSVQNLESLCGGV